jgi:hypothetical protein
MLPGERMQIYPHKYASIVWEINIHGRNFEVASFSFDEGRRSNMEAQNLARHALSSDPGRHLGLLELHDPICIPVTLAFE